MKVAVVGHVEWVEFLRVPEVPKPGQIVHAGSVWEGPAGGGATAAVQLRKLAGACTFYTAFGDDDLGRRSLEMLRDHGLRVEAVIRPERQRRAPTFVDDAGERTITVIGSRLGPRGTDPLPWDELDDTDAVYFCAGDDDALHHARRARVLVATARERERLARSGVELDALVRSGRDPAERYTPGDILPPPRLDVATDAMRGGTWGTPDGRSGTFHATPPPGPVVDTYGAGDAFAAGLTFALGRGEDLPEALDLAARCGSFALTGRGPYEGQLALDG